MKNFYIMNTALGLTESGLMAQIALGSKNEEPIILGPFSVGEKEICYLLELAGVPTWENMINVPIQAEVVDGKVLKLCNFIDEDKYIDFEAAEADTEHDEVDLAIEEAESEN